jgi:hypothetical protein
MANVRVLHCDRTLATAEVGCVCVVVWRGAVTRVPFDRQRDALAGVLERHPDGAGFLCIVEKSAGPPDDELRRASAQMIKSHGATLKCVACVIEGDGFVASIHRSVVSGMILLLGRIKKHVSVFANVGQAAVWMRGHVELGSPREFTAAVEEVRSRLNEAL